MKAFSLRIIFLVMTAGGFALGVDGAASANHFRWGGLDLRNCMINLKNETRVRWFFFHGDGTVSATLGRKEGSVSQPLLEWRISGKWLQILDPEDGKLLYQMLCLTSDAKQITVDNGRGEKEQYEIEEKGAK